MARTCAKPSLIWSPHDQAPSSRPRTTLAETIQPRNIDRIKALGGGIAVQHRMAYQGEDFAKRYGKEMTAEAPPTTIAGFNLTLVTLFFWTGPATRVSRKR